MLSIRTAAVIVSFLSVGGTRERWLGCTRPRSEALGGLNDLHHGLI